MSEQMTNPVECYCDDCGMLIREGDTDYFIDGFFVYLDCGEESEKTDE